MAKRKRKPSTDASCPCGTGDLLARCCGPYLDGAALAPTAGQLMRSRYAAYVTRNLAHLLRTWHPDTRPPAISFDPNQEWEGLEIVATESGAMLDTTGTVEFIAQWNTTSAGQPLEGTLHERSRFVRIDGAWVYLDGQVL